MAGKTDKKLTDKMKKRLKDPAFFMALKHVKSKNKRTQRR